MNLSHIQKHLPWTVPYSQEFNNSKLHNRFRQTTHDMLHIMKSAGRIATICESSDHADAGPIHTLPKELASIVMSAMYIASTHNIDLEREIKKLVFEKNGVSIPNEN